MIQIPPIVEFETFEASTAEMLKPPAPAFGMLRWDQQDDKAIQQYEWTVAGLIPRRETVLWFGESQSGKSFSAFDAAIHVASGKPYQGRRTLRGGVIYCFIEKGHGARNRMRAFRQFHDLPLVGMPFSAVTHRIDIFSEQKTIDDLAAACIDEAKAWDVPLDVIVIDTHDKATPGASEIDKKDVSTILSRYERLRDLTKAGVWIIGHSNSFGTARGSLVLYNAIETVIAVSVMKAPQTGELRDANGRIIREARVAKQSEGEAGTRWKFVLPPIEVGINEFGEPITSCVVVPPSDKEGDDPVAGKGFSPTTNDSAFLRAVVAALDQFGTAPPPGMALPGSILKVVKYEHVKKVFRTQNPDDGDDIPKWRERLKQQLRRARERMQHHRIVAVDGDDQLIWLTGRPVAGIIKAAPEQAPRFSEPVDPRAEEAVREMIEGGIQL